MIMSYDDFTDTDYSDRSKDRWNESSPISRAQIDFERSFSNFAQQWKSSARRGEAEYDREVTISRRLEISVSISSFVDGIVSRWNTGC